MRIEKTFPALISKTRFRCSNSLMGFRATKVAHPRRGGCSYLLSGLAKCKTCNRGNWAKSGTS